MGSFVEGPKVRRVRARAAQIRWAWTCSLGLLGGCDALRIGNPFLPKANLLASADDATTTVKIEANQGASGAFKFTVNPTTMKVSLRPFPGDITPGVRINAYSIDWFDMNASPISPNILPPRVQGVSVYLARGGGGSSTGGRGDTNKQLEIPVVTNPLLDYGISNGFLFNPATQRFGVRTDNWSQYLTGRITFSGRDDNGYPVENLSTNFTLKFETTDTGTP